MAEETKKDEKVEHVDAGPTAADKWEAPNINDEHANRILRENKRLVARLNDQDENRETEVADRKKVGLSPSDGLHEGVSLSDNAPLFTYDAAQVPKKNSAVDLSGKFKSSDPDQFPAKP